MTGSKLRDIRAMLKVADQPEEEVRACLRAVKMIEDAHELRNELIHGHWSRTDNVNETTFALSKAGSHAAPPSVTWNIQEFERCWVEQARASQIAAALFKTAQRWRGITLGERWDLATAEELAGRFTLSKINDSGGGFGSFIRYTGLGIEEKLRELSMAEDEKWFPGRSVIYPDPEPLPAPEARPFKTS
ncbi:MAG: hypothetical protein HIU88_05680 [Acidobacteria bacterium]|nr:hypothetical protein [Acidobacteriota bacterium]